METKREKYGDDSELIAPERIDLSLDRDATWLLTSSINPCAGNLHIKVTSTLRRHDNPLKYSSKNVQVQLFLRRLQLLVGARHLLTVVLV